MKKTTAFISFLAALVLVGSGCNTVRDGGIFVAEDISSTEWQQRVFVGQNGRRSVTISDLDVQKIEVDEQNDAVMYLGSYEGIWKTTTAGEQWYQLPVPGLWTRDVEIHPTDSNIVYAVQGETIIKTTDAGETWDTVYTDVQNSTVTRVELDWFNPDRILAVTSLGSVVMTEDAGTTWRVVYEVKEPIVGLHMSQQDSRTIYIQELDGAIHKSTNGGTEWTNLFDEEFYKAHRKADAVKRMALDPNNDRNVYAVTPEGILRSQDGGGSWSLMQTLIEQGADQNLSIRNITVMPGDQNTIIFTIGRLIYRTSDGGISWESIESFPSNRRINEIVVQEGETQYIIIGVVQPEDQNRGLLPSPN